MQALAGHRTGPRVVSTSASFPRRPLVVAAHTASPPALQCRPGLQLTSSLHISSESSWRSACRAKGQGNSELVHRYLCNRCDLLHSMPSNACCRCRPAPAQLAPAPAEKTAGWCRATAARVVLLAHAKIPGTGGLGLSWRSRPAAVACCSFCKRNLISQRWTTWLSLSLHQSNLH